MSGSDYTPRERAVLARAFQVEYQSRTCIRFVPKTEADVDFLYIGKIDGCYSDVGRAGGRQELSLDDGCLHLDTVIHELVRLKFIFYTFILWDVSVPNTVVFRRKERLEISLKGK
ncbi:unnamed protein product [Meloidogyne enterolobii]|uniref:Uncharacterized protein n=1 Tax=Meloidogyne enterolobii TaxID=390850 RepID=A0ACB1AXN7_MELEN